MSSTSLAAELITLPDGVVAAPEWLRDLVIYEIATKAYTSPNGPESGTFESLRAHLPYVADLGVTGIWLTGHQLSDPTHFYNIWTQYACIDPAALDPSLGTPDDFRRLVDAAHNHGIKVFLDVITHGLMHDSPIVRDHPDWFQGGSWGMTDFDWYGGHADLDEWWVKTWVDYVAHFGIDGFRLDVATYRWDLWQRIRREAAALGHPIVILTEHGPGYVGVNDLFQRSAIKLSVQTQGLDPTSPMLNDVAGFIQRMVTPESARYGVTIECKADRTFSTGDPAAPLAVTASQVTPEVVRNAAGRALWVQERVTLTVAGLPPGDEIFDISVDDGQGQHWRLQPWVEVDHAVALQRRDSDLQLDFIAKYPRGQYLTVQLSSHDNGWDGSPLGVNPYAAQGSRFVFGYGLLLAPTVPLFMAGEEFDADYRPLPALSPKLFGGEGIGEGRWLYGSWLDWEQVKQPAHAAMLQDVKRLIALRRQFRYLIYPLRVGDSAAHLHGVNMVAASASATGAALPRPYLYAAADEALLVAGNPDPEREREVTLAVPVAALGWQPADRITLRDLWGNAPDRVVTAATLERLSLTLPRDKMSRGGLAILHLRRTDK